MVISDHFLGWKSYELILEWMLTVSLQVFVEELLYVQQHDMFWEYKNEQDMVPAF